MASHSRTTQRAVAAATAGSTIEFYDFLLYGVVAALVFPEVFFPQQNRYAGVLLSFSTYFIGFCARPIGAAIFGHFGDRIGRKRTLVMTMLTMGVGTVGVGLIPPYSAIGPAGAFLLVACRLLQGLGVGGEWGGANLLAMESGSVHHRGLLTSFPQAGAMLGLAGANLAVFIMTAALPDRAFVTWGWRLPFLASGGLFVLGLWLRARVEETPEFKKVVASGTVQRRPLTAVLRHQPGDLVLCLLVKVAEMVPVYLFSAFILAYGTRTLGLERGFLLLAVAGAALIAAVVMPFVGHWSDRVGHERVYQLGAVGMIGFAFVYFAAIGTAIPAVVGPAVAVSLVPYAVMFGTEGAIFGKTFRPEWRYSGSSLAFNLAGIIGGGPAPFIATWLLTRYGNPYTIATYIAAASVVGFAAVTTLRLRNSVVALQSADESAHTPPACSSPDPALSSLKYVTGSHALPQRDPPASGASIWFGPPLRLSHRWTKCSPDSPAGR
jgi:MFS family permease